MNQLKVSVVNADLRMSTYPILVGHFKEDGIINSEKSLNARLKNKLGNLHELELYPSELKRSEVLLDMSLSPKGAIIVGLDESHFLSAHNLSITVESAVKNYILGLKDKLNDEEYLEYGNGISSLCVGSGFGNLSIEESLTAILTGISRANIAIDKLSKPYTKIEYVEFVEDTNHIASRAYATLFKLNATNVLPFQKLHTGIIRKHGRKRNSSHEEHNKKWHVFTTERLENKVDSFRIRSNSGNACILEEVVDFENKLMKSLLNGSYWESKESMTMFQRMIPNSFKRILKSHLDVVWQLDKYAAEFPWELFHASEENEIPTFVNTGLIRQLISNDFRVNPKITRSNSALVIGAPLYDDTEGLSPLAEAREEAKEVSEKLNKEAFCVKPMFGDSGENNFKALLNMNYKVLHVAAHGKYSHEDGKVGIALGGGHYFGPMDFNSIDIIPEFVFINCCYSGKIDAKDEEYNQQQYKHAANIGTQLIEMGTEAVIVAGWVVNDKTAKEFASILYDNLLNGHTFGDAVKKARQHCYKISKTTTTWAAFQCYGNPEYRLVKKTPTPTIQNVYIFEEDVLDDLHNLLSTTENIAILKTEDCLDELEECIIKAKRSEFLTSKVIEKQAQIYYACGQLERSFEKYSELLEKENASFSLKSVEQYCNILAKVLMKRYKESPTNVTEDDRANLLLKLESLIAIGKTSERLSLQGSGYKRLAYMEQDPLSASQYLDHMRNKYNEAYEKAKTKDFQKSIYSFTNWYSGIALTQYSETQRKECCQELVKIQQKLSDEIVKGEDFWDDISVVNVTMCQMLFTDPNDTDYLSTLEELKAKALDNYSQHWDKAGNKKHLLAETEHLEVLIRFVKDPVVRERFEEMLGELKIRCESEMEEYAEM